MKRYSHFLLLCLYMLAITSVGSTVFAQISEGGTPASFAFGDDIRLRSTKAPFITPIDFDVVQLRSEDKLEEEYGTLPRTSMIIPVNLNMDNAGEWSVLPDGTRIWRLAVKAPDAIAVMLYYDRFFIPEGGRLFIYNAYRTHLIGAYTSNTNPNDKKFVTEFVAGDEIILEYNELQPQTDSKPDIRISGVGYGYNYLDVYQNDIMGIGDKIGGIIGNPNCQVNINCPEGHNWQDHKKGVAKTVAPVGNSGYLCSGSLVNNTAQDLTPYYLSAHHCFDDSRILFDQIIFYFHYESPECANATPTGSKTLVGAQMLVDLPIKGSSDGALLQLHSAIPDDYNVYYNGWDRRNQAATSGVGIHHPKGEIKKISTFTSTVTNSRWNGQDGPGAENAHWQVNFTKTQSGYSQTEGGSSGSPLFNQAGLIVGTLTGGTAANCNTGSNNWYGKLWYHWDNANAAGTKTIKDYLDPLNTGVETLNGRYGSAIGNTDLQSLSVNPGTLNPTFSASRTSYNVNVANSTASITVSAKAVDNNATVSGTGTHRLNVGANTIRVIVTTPDKSASKTYTITVNRAIVLAADRYEPNNTLAQAFTLPVTFTNNEATVETTGSNFHNEADVDYYKINLPSGYHYSITAWLHDLYFNNDDKKYTVDAKFDCSTNGSNWSVEYDDVMKGNIVILNGGTVYFRVNPYVKGDIGDYLLAISIERKQAGTNNNAGLSALSVSQGTLTPVFNTNTTTYSGTVGSSVTGVLIEATATNANAVISGIGYHPIQVGNNTIPVVVTAQDGTTKKTYTLTVIRRSEASNNANLQSLTIDRGELNPRFDAGQTDYSVHLEETVTSINISATAADEYATVAGTGEYPLKIGINDIDIVVTAENGSTIKTYKIFVYRGGYSNANLRSLTIDRGNLVPAFNPNTTNYSVTVGRSVDRILVQGEPAETDATITGNGYHRLSLGATNVINLVVTSPNTSTKKTYTLSVYRDLMINIEDVSEHPLVVYPNPARDQITVSGLTGSGVLTLINVTGSECMRREITSTEEIISVSTLPTGIYFVRIIEKERAETIKIVVK